MEMVNLTRRNQGCISICNSSAIAATKLANFIYMVVQIDKNAYLLYLEIDQYIYLNANQACHFLRHSYEEYGMNSVTPEPGREYRQLANEIRTCMAVCYVIFIVRFYQYGYWVTCSYINIPTLYQPCITFCNFSQTKREVNPTRASEVIRVRDLGGLVAYWTVLSVLAQRFFE